MVNAVRLYDGNSKYASTSGNKVELYVESMGQWDKIDMVPVRPQKGQVQIQLNLEFGIQATCI